MNYLLLKMKPDPEYELERQVDRVLKRLPEIPAPRTLMPRVLAMVRTRAELP